MIKKVKFSKGFAKQEMVKRAAEANLNVYAVLHEKTGDVNPQGLFMMEKHFNSLTEKSINHVIEQEKQYVLAKSKMFTLRLLQMSRREKLLKWFEKYIKSIENKENTQVIKRYAFGLEKEYKTEIMNSFYDEFEDYSHIIEQLQIICGYVNLIEQAEDEPIIAEEVEIEEQAENEAQTVNIDPEKAEPKEDQEKAEGEYNGPLLAASEAPQGEKETKKEREEKQEESGEETSQKKAERFLKVATS